MGVQLFEGARAPDRAGGYFVQQRAERRLAMASEAGEEERSVVLVEYQNKIYKSLLYHLTNLAESDAYRDTNHGMITTRQPLQSTRSSPDGRES